MTMTRNAAAQTPREKMAALVDAQPISTLAYSLGILGTKPELDEAEILTHAAIIDSICRRHPGADEAFGDWAESTDDPRTAAEVILEAIA